MSTNSTISAVFADGSIRSVYCHWDGYVEWNGMILNSFYNTQEKAEAVVSHGDISSLNRYLFPNGRAVDSHSFDSPYKGVSVLYCRDRGDKMRIERYKDLDGFAQLGGGLEFNYLWNDWEWYVSFGDSKRFELVKAYL